jgi:hypothetical protein
MPNELNIAMIGVFSLREIMPFFAIHPFKRNPFGKNVTPV